MDTLRPATGPLKIAALLFIWMGSVTSGHAQLLLMEDFDYAAGDTLSQHGWVVAGGGSSQTLVADSGLTYTGYGNSGIGNAVLLNANPGPGHEDYAKTFETQTSGVVYVSFLIRAAAVDRFASFNYLVYVTRPTGTGGWGRVHIEINGSGEVGFGLAQFTEIPVQTPFAYALNTTYLIVLKYTVVDGDNNDEASLFVFSEPDLPASEPATPTLGPVASNALDPSGIARVVVRRAASSDNDLLVDGIRVATSWGDAPLPVELVYFDRSVSGNRVVLSWQTAHETNHYGFQIERRDHSEEWGVIGFIEGHGTTKRAQDYHFVDDGLAIGTYEYRLRQIDLDGSIHNLGALTAVIHLPPSPGLVQNYPNPFNPSTSITYAVDQPSQVIITIYDSVGRVVRTLENRMQSPGLHTVVWNGLNDTNILVSSGIYTYTLRTGFGLVETKRMILLR